MPSKPAKQEEPEAMDGMSWVSHQALAISAVDGIRPSDAAIALMRSIDSGAMNRAQAIQAIVERARNLSIKQKT